MKEIKAYIKPHKLSAVAMALRDVKGLSGMSVTEGKGFGRGRAEDSADAVTEQLVDFVPHAEIRVICKDELVDQIVDAICDAAHTGLRGDGKIYIAAIEGAVRISTGETGTAAI